jgi:hypothetical protein
MEKLLAELKTEEKDRASRGKDQLSLMNNYPNICSQDPETGKWYHDDPDCLVNREMFVSCPTETLLLVQRKLDNLQGLFAMTLFFRYPELASEQKTLNIYGQDGLIKRYS